ncbi:MAG: hypothetical protein V6Z81_09925 [Parvularculales bacterium]
MFAVKVTKFGSSEGIELPEEVIRRLQVKVGDTLYLAEGPDGLFRLTSLSPAEFDKRMKNLEKIRHKDRNILATLAKEF